MQGLYGFITLGFFIIYLIFHVPANAFMDMSTSTVVLMFADMLCYPAFLFWQSRQRYEFKYRWLVIITLLMSSVNIFGGVIVVYFSESKDLARIAFSVIVDVCFCGFFFVWHFIKGRTVCVPKFWKFALKFNIPLVPHYLSEILLSQSDRIMISQLVSYTAAANYTVAYSIVTMLQLIMNAVSASFIPWAYEKIKHGLFDDIRKLSITLMLGISSLMLILMLLAPEIIYVFAGSDYISSIYVVPPLTMSVFFLFLYEMFSLAEFYYGKTVFVMFASIVAAGLNVLLNFIMIPIFGYYAAGYTTLICYFIYAIAHYILYRMVSRKEMDGVKLFNVKAIVITGIILGAITFLINLIYSYMIIRYAILAAIIVVVIYKRKAIISQIGMLKSKGE